MAVLGCLVQTPKNEGRPDVLPTANDPRGTTMRAKGREGVDTATIQFRICFFGLGREGGYAGWFRNLGSPQW